MGTIVLQGMFHLEQLVKALSQCLRVGCHVQASCLALHPGLKSLQLLNSLYLHFGAKTIQRLHDVHIFRRQEQATMAWGYQRAGTVAA